MQIWPNCSQYRYLLQYWTLFHQSQKSDNSHIGDQKQKSDNSHWSKIWPKSENSHGQSMSKPESSLNSERICNSCVNGGSIVVTYLIFVVPGLILPLHVVLALVCRDFLFSVWSLVARRPFIVIIWRFEKTSRAASDPPFHNDCANDRGFGVINLHFVRYWLVCILSGN